MEFSGKDRLMIAMLCDIYKALKIKNGSVDPDLVMDLVSSGRDWGLAWQYPGLFSEQDDPNDVQLTADMLDMWRSIKGSYNRLSPKEQAELDARLDPFDVGFPGFDGHGPYRGIARCMIKNLGRFQEFDRKEYELDSHGSPPDDYQIEALGRWRSAFEANHSVRLTPDQIVAVLVPPQQENSD